ncbi:MAG: hypothetical protein SF172_13380 [Burkholderiales bacterium]|nr:hypothetical protein [Burkholderiales bacterium]
MKTDLMEAAVSALHNLRMLARYITWANVVLFDALGKLPAEVLIALPRLRIFAMSSS